jgi:predicted acyl esterase
VSKRSFLPWPFRLFLPLHNPTLRVPPQPAYPDYPSETPAAFTTEAGNFDYVRREAMIPMRDGVKLYTVILVPKGARNAPVLLTRTPYSAKDLTGHAASSHLGSILYGYDNATDVIVEGGYIRVVQDIPRQIWLGGGTM